MWRGLIFFWLLTAVPAWAGEGRATTMSLGAETAGSLQLRLSPDVRQGAPDSRQEQAWLPFGKPFDRRDQELVALSSLLLVVDWGQTLDLSRQPECYFEHNAALGLHPSPAAVNRYFASALIGNLVLSRLLEGKWRRAWLWTLNSLQLGVTRNNESIGLQMRFEKKRPAEAGPSHGLGGTDLPASPP